MNKFAARLVPLAAVAALALAGQGLAQGYGPPSGPPGPNGPPAPNPADQARELRATLGLRPDQEPALQSYLQAVTPSPAQTARMRQSQAGVASMTTPERLDQMLAHMDEMRATMANRVEATKRFYFQLTPAQRRAFDTMRAPGQQQRPAGY